MLEHSLILCGGTGAHVSAAFLRLHTLGHALGYFRYGKKPMVFPKLFLIDQDAGDSSSQKPSAWQLSRSLLLQHPARFDWSIASTQTEAPDCLEATPLPVGGNKTWFQSPNQRLRNRFKGSELLDVLASDRQKDIDYSKGMMGSPAIGSLLFHLKQFDERGTGLNCDDGFRALLDTRGRVVVVGSGIGGTGASVVPTLAKRLAGDRENTVMAVMLLNWFEFEEATGDEGIRIKASERNRLMRENANSALSYYGQSLAEVVAAVPVGMPETALGQRTYTGDIGQPIHESYLHVVGALCAFRHYLEDQPFGAGLYYQGAVQAGRLDPATAIPGGTLQDLAHRAATLVATLDAFCRVLETEQGRIPAAIWEEVADLAEPVAVARSLRGEVDHMRSQLEWMETVLKIHGSPAEDFLFESAVRARLESNELTSANNDPSRVASELFYWTTAAIREMAKSDNGLVVAPGNVTAAHWPDLRNMEGLGISPRSNGSLDPVPDSNRDATLEAFVRREFLSCNGWPDPLAPVFYFDGLIRRQDPLALRQLELILAGLFLERLRLVSLEVPVEEHELSLERVVTEARRKGLPGLASCKVVAPDFGDRVVAFASPLTLFCPTPEMDAESGEEIWNDLWQKVIGRRDGASWREADEPLQGDFRASLQRLRAWIDQEMRSRPKDAPPWTVIFERHQSETALPCGLTEQRIRVFWGSAGDSDRQSFDVPLPSRHFRKWAPGEDLERIEEAVLVERVPEIREVEDEQGMLFREVMFRVPGQGGRIRGFWADHLEWLRNEGKIFIYGAFDDGTVAIGLMVDNLLKVVKLEGSRLLTQETICIDQYAVFEQDPIDGHRQGEPRFRIPDLPVRADYLELVRAPEGEENLVAILRRGHRLEARWLKERPIDGGGGLDLEWVLPMEGRRDPLEVTKRIDRGEIQGKAHLMVWPRFRSADPALWKAYYVYEHFADNRFLTLDTLWVSSDGEVERLVRDRKTEKQRRELAYPVAFRTGSAEDDRVHCGGPPVAFSIRHERQGEQGLLLVPLQTLGAPDLRLSLGVDFGTSHTVAAFKRENDRESKLLRVAPDLRARRQDGGSGLTLHLSEDAEHVRSAAGPVAQGKWLPTYSDQENYRYLPSELLAYEVLDHVQSDDLDEWRPLSHFTIPAFGVGREDMALYLLTDFKWQAGSKFFQGREAALRESYLAMVLEIVLAEVVFEGVRGVPTREVDLTLTYPLRLGESEIEELQSSLRRVAGRVSKSLGIPLALKDGVGIYDESRAAAVSAELPGEVSLVADLGGGTLDLFLSAVPVRGEQLPVVADSLKLGGNQLLRRISESDQRLLPRDGGWKLTDSSTLVNQLQAWMRAYGAPSLFGTGAEGRKLLGGVNIRGFENGSENRGAREMIHRYFLLIGEYLTRNLAAYLARFWYPVVAPDAHDELKLSVQLRGNGWKMHYVDEAPEVRTRAVQKMVCERLKSLWAMVPESELYPDPSDPAVWRDPADYYYGDPKSTSIRNATGRAMSIQAVKDRWLTFTLADLDLERSDGRDRIAWTTPMPMTVRNGAIKLRDISPSVRLSSPSEEPPIEVSSLKVEEIGKLNQGLASEAITDPGDGSYIAKIGPWLWEALFHSPDFWPRR